MQAQTRTQTRTRVETRARDDESVRLTRVLGPNYYEYGFSVLVATSGGTPASRRDAIDRNRPAVLEFVSTRLAEDARTRDAAALIRFCDVVEMSLDRDGNLKITFELRQKIIELLERDEN